MLFAICAQSRSARHDLADFKKLSSVCKGLKLLRRLPAVRLLASRAAHELVSSARLCMSPDPRDETYDVEEATLIDLSGRSIGEVECSWIALKLAEGGLRRARLIWLQNNEIDASGLRALAGGIRQMQSRPLTISLGMNPFAGRLPDSAAAQRMLARSEVRRALRELKKAANERGVCLRLFA